MKNHLKSGISLLIVGGIAGFLWHRLGASFTFYAGAGVCVAALSVLCLPRAFATLLAWASRSAWFSKKTALS